MQRAKFGHQSAAVPLFVFLQHPGLVTTGPTYRFQSLSYSAHNCYSDIIMSSIGNQTLPSFNSVYSSDSAPPLVFSVSQTFSFFRVYP